jgi:hypothetical protein
MSIHSELIEKYYDEVHIDVKGDYTHILKFMESINKIDENDYFTKLVNVSPERIYTSLCIMNPNFWNDISSIMMSKAKTSRDYLIIADILHSENIGMGKNKEYDLLLRIIQENLKIETDVKTIEIMNFSKEILRIINDKSIEESFAVLGAIEYIYCKISQMMYRYLATFINLNEIVYYTNDGSINYVRYNRLFEYLSYVHFSDVKVGLKYGCDLMDYLYSKATIHFV